VTERVGALSDRYLARDRPLGEARLIWEIGADGCDLRELRTRLGLDSGYLSRLLRSLEAAGLVTVDASREDRRVRTASLTRRGLAERELLDQRSDELARSFLEPLSHARRERLVAAMAEVERLLTAGLVQIDAVDLDDHAARQCLDRYFAEIARRFDEGFDPDETDVEGDDEMRPPAGLFLIARLRGEPVGCGGLKLHGRTQAEVKRMWVSESVRGLGLGRRMLAELESRAIAAGARVIRLDTNSALPEAVGLYRSAGYREIPAFNTNPYAHHWFEKRVGRTRSRASGCAR
jgi:DNA-binding MarR family transcriptional regulator/GNAT superfamily N-acetyltransferase